MKYMEKVYTEYPLRQEMKKRGLSARQLANDLDISISYLYMVINEKNGVSKEQYEKIINAVEKYND